MGIISYEYLQDVTKAYLQMGEQILGVNGALVMLVI